MTERNREVKDRQEIAARLKDAGCDVDLSGTDWHTTGEFLIAKYPQWPPKLEVSVRGRQRRSSSLERGETRGKVASVKRCRTCATSTYGEI